MAGRTHAGGLRTGTSRSETTRAEDQRTRLLEAIIALTAREGYLDLSVARVAARAQVSRSTFYEHFTDKEDCLATALGPLASSLLSSIDEAVAAGPPQRAVHGATGALVTFAARRPLPARLLVHDTLTGGSRLREVRARLFVDAAAIVDAAHTRAPSGSRIADLPPELILATVARALASRLCVGAASPRGLAVDLGTWIAAYEHPVVDHQWAQLAALQPPPSPYLAPLPLRPPAPSARARAGAESNWLRIVFATAEVIAREGYGAATVAEIARRADLRPGAFYALFDGKRAAFAAANELLFRHVMAATAGAFVVGENWPERVWEGARALAQSAARNPTLSAASLRQGDSGGSAARIRIDELAAAFVVFLQEGGSDDAARRDSQPASSDFMLEAIAAAVFELGHRHACECDPRTLSCLHPHVVFIALVPFVGPRAAAELLRRKAAPSHVAECSAWRAADRGRPTRADSRALLA